MEVYFERAPFFRSLGSSCGGGGERYLLLRRSWVGKSPLFVMLFRLCHLLSFKNHFAVDFLVSSFSLGSVILFSRETTDVVAFLSLLENSPLLIGENGCQILELQSFARILMQVFLSSSCQSVLLR